VSVSRNLQHLLFSIAKQGPFRCMRACAPLSVAGLILGAFFVPRAAGVELIEESVITDEGLYFWYPGGRKAFHYAASISPRGDCYTVANGYIFFGWYKGGMDERDLMISRKKIGSGKWVTVQLPHKNTLIGPGAVWGESHNTITVGVSTKDDTIHIFYDHHNDPLKYIVSKKGTAFVPDHEFKIDIFEPTRGYLAEGQPIRITYPKITENGLGDLIVNYRKGSAIGGNEMVHVYNGEVWSRARQVTRGSDQTVPESRKNYAYSAAPVFANGNVYYAFSVRWKRNKEKGVLNEGVYLAKCGPTMTDDWEDPWGNKHQLPIEDYSPFLVADPDSSGNKGANGGPPLAVSESGDIVLGFRGRGSNNRYDYLFTRAAGQDKFQEEQGSIQIGTFWGDRMYSASASRDGTVTVRSKTIKDKDWTEELKHKNDIRFGSSVSRLVDGILVLIVEDRTNSKTDKKKIHCYALKVREPKGGAPNLPRVKRFLTNREDGRSVEVELVDVKQGTIICFAKGRQFEITISALSDEDIEFLKQWIKNQK